MPEPVILVTEKLKLPVAGLYAVTIASLCLNASPEYVIMIDWPSV